MKHKHWHCAVALSLFLLVACSEQKASIPTFTVNESAFAIEVSAFGEIEAAEAQKIISPGTQPMTLAWLQDENTQVQQGDIIAVFDAQQIIKDSRTEELEMLKLQQDIVSNFSSQSQQQNDIASDQTFVKHEFAFVDRFAIDDLRIYSQLEIIDTLQNRDFLEAKDEFLSWKEGSIEQQHDSEMAVLSIRKSGHEAKYERFKSALSKLEVVAPHAGLLIYEKDRRGEKPSVGQTIFPGRTLAQIPNLDNLQARAFVLANDAIDLAIGQAVSVYLDAFPEQSFAGTITNVAGFPRSIERGSPVTYYEIEISLAEQDKEKMQPGRKLSAKIQVKSASPAITIPLQALHHDDGVSYVYLQQDQEFVRTAVTSGRKNLYRVEITEGLQIGDNIALSKVDTNAQTQGAADE